MMRSAAHTRHPFRALTLTLVSSIAGLATTPTHSSAAPLTESSLVELPGPHPMLYAVEVQTYLNAHRAEARLAPVALQWQLNQAAQNHAYDMARRRLMTHTGSDGSRAGARITRTGYRWSLWGENIAAGQTTARQVVTAWMNSPAHRAIMLDGRFRHIGLGRALGPNGVVYWCLVFARPA